MEAHEISHEEHSVYRLGRNRFVMLIIGTIVIALLLVLVSLGLYAASGAAQLDLSRPDYKGVRDQISESDEYAKAFASTGPIDEQAIEDFRKLYKDAVHQATTVPVYADDSLSDTSLGITPKKDTSR
jgi:hypothetical protein